jgi:DNA-binding TFAR19-related protein (PDSD5 family)
LKIRSVTLNRRRHVVNVRTSRQTYPYPFSRLDPAPTSDDDIVECAVDAELGREAFSHRLRSGRVGSVHIEQVLEAHEDPRYMRDLLLYKLTIEAQARMESTPLSKRELARRLKTSLTQIYRLLDQTNYRKSVDQVLGLLRVLDCDVDFVVRTRSA